MTVAGEGLHSSAYIKCESVSVEVYRL